MGSFLSRALVMVFGYAYPAYKCFKAVESVKPNRDHLLFWCHYWILVAVLTILERIGDALISWLPMYNEAKVVLFIYLWYPRTEGTVYVYNLGIRPYMKKHEKTIDENLEEIKNKGATIAVLFWQKAMRYSQARFVEILEFAHSKSTAVLTSRQQLAQPSASKNM